MPQALGLVETKGLVGAIVAADAMVKAANVTIIGKEKVAPALITIKIIGETAAVKSAIEAGAAAAQRVGQLISTHLIPHPDTQLGILFPEILTDIIIAETEAEVVAVVVETQQFVEEKEIPVDPAKEQNKHVVKKEKKQTKSHTPKKEVENTPVSPKESPKISASLFDEVGESKSKPKSSTLERLKAEALKDIQADFIPPIEEKKEAVSEEQEVRYDFENSTHSLEDLESFNVHQLRKLARGVEIFPIHGREISRANRETLLAYFKSLKK